MAGSVSQRIVVAQDELNERQSTGRMALFNEDGTPFTGGGGGDSYTPPAEGTAAELEAGTETELRLFSPKVIHDEIARQIAAIPPAAE
ncbi:hypothetical protein FDJ44_gp07 [Microbacterium phage Pikmin]|uniref:Uncharacterized protein n=3 Tax=Pikminvirus pikmin TaxID=2560596 RepID=A0A2P1CKD5_9CAUD|nr:hypothetical protein FDJ44_gp07 [Microbacterium phage Pikmin]AVJ50998.1 hypothetical protein PBI_PAJAZA_7 [Microbacterium phage Pajaza]AVJ51145.1 hypothetical protein PBI_PIKMIN_7 [Microbacterium phage Pikmin]AVJ51703.1 hypothetical protein PBI_CASEY_7 [Microbacterium phage Casey]